MSPRPKHAVKGFQTWAVTVEFSMTEQKNVRRPDHDLEAEALAALEEARAMPHGPERARAMKRAGNLRYAADLAGIAFAKRGRPTKTAEKFPTTTRQ
jgi:hypothetical protein